MDLASAKHAEIKANAELTLAYWSFVEARTDWRSASTEYERLMKASELAKAEATYTEARLRAKEARATVARLREGIAASG